MERIKQENLLTGFATLDLKAGIYKGIFLRVYGVNVALATMLLADCGSIKLQIPGVPETSIDFASLNQRTNLYWGVAEAASAVGAAFAFSARLDFFKKNDKTNCVTMSEKQKSQLQWIFDPTVLAAKAASGIIEINAIYDDGSGMEKYVPVYRNQQSPAAAARLVDEDIPLKYVEELFVINDANISLAKITRDGKSVVDVTWPSQVAFSNTNNTVETAIPFVEVVGPDTEAEQNIQQTHLQLTTVGALAGGVANFAYLAIVKRSI